MEPNLSFRYVEAPAGACLRVYFELESRPPWATSDVVEQQQCWLEFPVSELDLRGAAASLHEQLQKYPQRAAR